MMKLNRRGLFGLSILPFLSVVATAHDDKEQITNLMKSIFDKPEDPLAVAPVVVRGDDAIAGWSQGDKGGRALLWRKVGGWQIRLCSGASLKDAKMLEGAGFSPENAKAMTDELLAEEAKLDPVLVSRFDLFEGTVDMSGHGAEGGHSAHKNGTHKHGTETQ